ncbi:hypothetical protein K450DRAFT_224506 [Umbelopsis ramanniana AG]|uniref:Uncharacterized protein n=1 Tax=Umbelopsis ramanniana AG TaxID=1314678 RepID=A0AAD5EGM4_UMBRA|nr:uncharacterized protein K450DRAFT_224506 [Umbelopsis ramanniana AG]KAI8583164.1 hypothetical protein K450DRAFT_224506 [Umbelopsis ramanniana AG]
MLHQFINGLNPKLLRQAVRSERVTNLNAAMGIAIVWNASCSLMLRRKRRCFTTFWSQRSLKGSLWTTLALCQHQFAAINTYLVAPEYFTKWLIVKAVEKADQEITARFQSARCLKLWKSKPRPQRAN